MRERCHILICFLSLMVGACFQTAYGQLGFDLKIDKPKPYDERILRAEKTEDKPLKAHKKFLQNLTTHYNYYYNASTKLNEIVDAAKASYKDDYTNLLAFYNFSLDVTAQNTTQLDSVIYKAQTGIVLHDLRSDWADNMYLLWGAAYFFGKKFDSASLMFQFINYAFADKEKDGYYRYIGSRLDGSNGLTISTKESNKFPKNTVTPPSRNNALLWQIRSMIELGKMGEAASLIATLKFDPNFPKRLNDDLEEVLAYWYYKNNIWDSSAIHLERALDQAKTKQERARWEYLAAQMFEKTGKYQEAQRLYAKSIGHTTDPVMDVYARLNIVRISKDSTENYIDKNIAELLKMAKRDKYLDYRDVIYYMAAQMEIERSNFPAAQELLLKSAKYHNGNLASNSKSYLMVADLAFDHKNYLDAAKFYDSVQVNDLTLPEAQKVDERKAFLSKLVAYTSTISRQDSLQRIAAMPEEERNDFINHLVKKLRKEQGLSDVVTTGGNPAMATNPAPDLFPGNQKGEWYFYNTNLKTQGAAQFKQNWGNRPNVDNWRRFAEVSQQLQANMATNNRNDGKNPNNPLSPDNNPTFASLESNLPLTPALLQQSNDSIQNAMYDLGVLYINELEDYPSAIETFENFRHRFPDYANMSEVLFQLYYSYTKTGNTAKAAEIKQLLMQKYPASRFASIVSTGNDPAGSATNNEETKTYENIYDLFISGKFEDAEAAKKQADLKYGTTHWQPQLLYIEAVYQIRQRNDSVAKNTLQTLIGQNPGSSLSYKAQNLIDVLNRRQQIEDELTKLQIERPKDDTAVKQAIAIVPPPVKKDTLVNLPKPVRKDTLATVQKRDVVINAPKLDIAGKKPVLPPKPASIYSFTPTSKQSAMIILDKVDPLFVNEVKNAFTRYNREKYYNQVFDITVHDFDVDKKLLLINGFANAQEVVEYVQKTKRIAASEIVPWLKPDKFSFSIITEANLPILLEKKDLEQYKKFLDQNLPGQL